jgi:hypothetical protein
MGIKEHGIRNVIKAESSSHRSSENILLLHVPQPGNSESPVPRYKHPPPVEHPSPGQTSTTTHLGQARGRRISAVTTQVEIPSRPRIPQTSSEAVSKLGDGTDRRRTLEIKQHQNVTEKR